MVGLDDEQKRFLWIAVGGVIAFLAVMILFRQNNNASSTTSTSASSSPSYVPTTDYVYTQDSYNQGPTPTPTSTPTSTSTPPAVQPIGPIIEPPNRPPATPPPPTRTPVPTPPPARNPAQFVTVGTWQNNNPPWNSYLSGIAAHEGESLSYLESLNPQIRNPNLIYPGQQIEVHPGSGGSGYEGQGHLPGWAGMLRANASESGYEPVDNLALAPMPY